MMSSVLTLPSCLVPAACSCAWQPQLEKAGVAIQGGFKEVSHALADAAEKSRPAFEKVGKQDRHRHIYIPSLVYTITMWLRHVGLMMALKTRASRLLI